MTRYRIRRPVLVSWCLCGMIVSGMAITPSDYAVRISALVQTSPPAIALQWPADPNATEYTLYRKALDATDWGTGMTLATNATNYLDVAVTSGTTYEYRISKSAPGYFGEGYLYGGIEIPLVESRGKVVLLVDNSFTMTLSDELARLQQDLVGDGWIVLRHDVPRMVVDPANNSPSVWVARSNELASVKALITSDYNADPANVKAVFLFGHVPVPYAGDLYPDTHPQHRGAWPADAFYGDMDELWTDSTVTSTGGSYARNRNVPGDGKFDAMYGARLPSLVELQVGRVDLANLPAFSQSELELLRNYLNKDHSFRCRFTTTERRGLIDDELLLSTGEPFAVSGWRNFAAFFGASNTFAGDWLTTLDSQSYLWGYGCGGGTFTSCSLVATTSQLAVSDPRVVFTMFFGSYFGDWDSQDNFLRAAIATPTYTLTSVWAGRPHWVFHHMALGETSGFSACINQNNFLYSQGQARFVHIALMGDPTLRMHIVAPPAGLVAAVGDSGGVDLTWEASPDTILGYHVYRAPTADGPFERVNTALIIATNFTEAGVNSNVCYMVRAVKLEVSGSGSYYNASQGIFAGFTAPPSLPVLTIAAQDTNKVYGAPLPVFKVSYAGFTNGDTPSSLSSPPVLSTTATEASPVGAYPIHVSGAVATNYTLRFVDSTLTILPAGTTAALMSSANPSLPDQSVSFDLTLSVIEPGAGTPTGQVDFKINETNSIGPIPLSGGTARFTDSTLSHGVHTIVAQYAGDRNFIGATNALLPAQVINTPPVAEPNLIERHPADGAKVAIATLLANDFDADADPVSFAGVSSVSLNGGTVVTNDQWIFYTPAPGFTNSDAFDYAIDDGLLPQPIVGTVTVGIREEDGPSPYLDFIELGNGTNLIRGNGIPARTYRIQFTDESPAANWLPLGTAEADHYGIFQIFDTNEAPQRFYRSVNP